MAFNYVGSRNGSGQTLTKPVVIKTSEVVAVGDAVETYSTGTVENGIAATPIKGILVAITTATGKPIVNSTHTAGTAHSPDTASVTADGTQYGVIDTNINSLYSATVSGTIGTTNSSDKVGARLDVDSANTTYGQLLETTATRTVGTPANFYSHGVDPQDSTRLIVSLAIPEELSVFE